MGIKQELPDGLDLCSCAEPPAEAAGHAGHGAVTLSWLHNDHQAQLMLWHQGLWWPGHGSVGVAWEISKIADISYLSLKSCSFCTELFSPEETARSSHRGGVCWSYSQLETWPCNTQQPSPGLGGISASNSSQNGSNGPGSHDLCCELHSYFTERSLFVEIFFVFTHPNRGSSLSFSFIATFSWNILLYVFTFFFVCMFSRRHGRNFQTMYEPGLSFWMWHASPQRTLISVHLLCS